MSINGSRASSALGGKTARACDSCLIKRARWFCAADDAFLCQSCDGAVHSANQLASRHDRVRLETSSCKASPAPAPAWHTKKARTPRNGKPSRPAASNHQLPVVPELGSDDPFPAEENDEQLFCRVPEFDGGEFCTEMVKGEELGFEMSMVFDDDRELNLDELLSSCDDDFAADVETLLGTGIADCDGIDGLLDEKTVKIEENRDEIDEEIARHFDPELDAELNWDFHCATNSPIGEETREIDTVKTGSSAEMENESKKLLQLNYEAVIAAWATQSNSNSPWTNGIRPQFNLDLIMSECMDGEWGGGGKREKDAGREARVSRYREKRRTRLFSKKIRYEVRKLNAEKRPRMKGRFVKRTAFLGTSSSSLPFHLITK